MLVSTRDRIAAGGPYDVVAITTLVPDPFPSDHVLLPWHAQRPPRTGLDERNAAVCSWLVEVDSSRVVRTIGRVPGKQLLQIDAVLGALRGDDEG